MSVVCPLKKYKYSVKFGDLGMVSFSEVSSMDAMSDPNERRVGNYEDKTNVKLKGLMKGDNVTFKHGVCENKELYDWMNTSDVRKMKPVNIEITLLDDEYTLATPTWSLLNARVVKIRMTDLNAIETLEVMCEQIVRVK